MPLLINNFNHYPDKQNKSKASISKHPLSFYAHPPHPANTESFSLHIDKQLQTTAHTPTLDLLSLSLHFFNLFSFYPCYIQLIKKDFADRPRAFPYTISKSLHDLNHPLKPSTIPPLSSHTSPTVLTDTTMGSEESREDRG